MPKSKKQVISEYMASLGQKGGRVGVGKAKARSSEQAKKANQASHEAKRKNKAGGPKTKN